jgi:AbrB family looped-hinge helix DNA binding protein
MMKTVQVSDKGQIAIPQAIRETLGIDKGDTLLLIQVDGKILLEKTQLAEKKLSDDFKDILKFNEKSLRSVWNNKEDEIWNKYTR